MGVGKKQIFILFTLGRYYVEANKRLKGMPLEVVISKKIFIDIVKQAHIAEKKERALYRNLEVLEKKKYISYENHCLKLTHKGQRMFERLNKEYGSYLNLAKILEKTDIARHTKAQTVFK
jgi:DNA-binding PadR family transcriptional regulator